MASKTICDLCGKEVIEPKYETRFDKLIEDYKRVQVKAGGLKEVQITTAKEGYGSTTLEFDVCRACLEALCTRGRKIDK